MITNYFVLSSLTREWNVLLSGASFIDAYSHLPNEVSLVFETSANGPHAIRVSTRPGKTFVYSQFNPGRPKSNVTTLFEVATGRCVERVAIAAGDRVISVFLTDGSHFEIHPYGSRANVYLVEDSTNEALVADAFKRAEALVGQPPPPTREATSPTGLDDPRLGSHLVREAAFRFPNDQTAGINSLSSDLSIPSPVAYSIDDTLLFSPFALGHLGIAPVESFDTVDAGVRWTVKNRSRISRLDNAERQLSAALEKSLSRWARRVDELEQAIRSESRAPRYEAWGHLLMAHPGAAHVGADQVSVPDILGDGSMVTIPLDARKSVVQNAERFYARARKTREEREHLDNRLADARANQERVGQLLSKLRDAASVQDIERFQKTYAEDLRRFVGGRTEAVASAPFRRFTIKNQFEVWVGRNAKENDLLTFEHAARHDLWMHARGTPGSHVILKVPGRDQKIDRRIKEIAAAIAAWFSSARGSALVPVQIAPKKFVSKPRGALPGVVRVQNEEVVLVKPGLPSGP